MVRIGKGSFVTSKIVADDSNLKTIQTLFKQNVIVLLDDLKSFRYV